jgi:hypothetical protein
MSELTFETLQEISNILSEAEIPKGPREIWIEEETYQGLPSELKTRCSNKNCEGGYVLECLDE